MRGLIELTDLGLTQPHVHLLLDGTRAYIPALLETIPTAHRGRVDEPIRLDNVYWIRRNVANVDNLRLTDQADATEEMRRYRAAGGGTVVELTTLGLARDPAGLAEISQASGAMLELAATGCYLEFDLFGRESSWHPRGPIDIPNDATRIDHLITLIDSGYLRQILISQDICS